MNIAPSLDIQAKQSLATQFSLDSALAIKYCRQADDIISKSIILFYNLQKSDQQCLIDLYTAKEKLIDAKVIFEKWEKKGQIDEIIEEINELKLGIDDITCSCEMWIEIIEQFCVGKIDDENKVKVSQAISKIQVGRQRLLSFAIGWSSRIQQLENRSKYIKLTKTQYESIKKYVNAILSDELKAFEEEKNLDNLSIYVFCARMFDFAVTKELRKL
ncbi:hypothetical protein BN1013_02478 [Candidatus Rubidus massiliensis]|nr:hypothetical protein BN1013_02478 [Candidatus Rubidus massiliensis]